MKTAHLQRSNIFTCKRVTFYRKCCFSYMGGDENPPQLNLIKG